MPEETQVEQNAQNGNRSSKSEDGTVRESESASNTQCAETAIAKEKDIIEERNNEETDKKANQAVDVRMIDFAHVFPTEAIDENYTQGLLSLMNYLRKLLSEQK